MSANAHRLGWIGMGRMGYPMAERLLKAGTTVESGTAPDPRPSRSRPKGATLVDAAADLADVDVLFTMVSTGKDLDQVYFGDERRRRRRHGAVPRIFVDCSSIGVEESAALPRRLGGRGAELIAAPVSGNGKCVKAGKLSAVASGPSTAYRRGGAADLEAIAGRGVSYVGEGELARICKIAHNVFLGVVIQNLAEITVLAQKAGVPRHAFLDFINNERDGLDLHPYKSHALVNLDWTTTFTPELLRKDLDLGLAGGARARRADAGDRGDARGAAGAFRRRAAASPTRGLSPADFAALLETVALQAGISLETEGIPVPTTGSIARIRNETCVIEECKAAERAATPGKAAETAAGHAAWSPTGHAHGLRAKPGSSAIRA